MKLKIEKKEIWVAIEDEDGSSAEFLINPLSAKEIAVLLDIKNPKGRFQSQPFGTAYDYTITKWRKNIADWREVETEKGAPLACNEINKELLYLYNSKVKDKLVVAIEEIEISFEEEKKIEIKNS